MVVGVGVVVVPGTVVVVGGGTSAPTLAMTVACWLVVSVVDAVPLASAFTTDDDNVPAVVVKETGAERSVLPLMSKTLAVTVVDPPFAGTIAGLAFTLTRPTAAVPTAILIAPSVPVVAPPDVAVMTAEPFAVPEKYLTTTRPPTSV